MEKLLRAIRPSAARRGPRQAGMPSPLARGRRRTPRGSYLVADYGSAPEVDDVAADLLLGADPRWSL